ncbi:MAG: ferrous iron transport protein A [Candidatus Thermoplasmatota archaeon]|nr:ferrous iron transport protein A [Candidatus Thermoplasmatota archaeon]
MHLHTLPLSDLPLHTHAKICSIQGGKGFQHKLQVMGIQEGRTIKILSKQPFKGPLTIKVCGTHLTLGRGMAQKIMVEVIL